ncbi:MAG: hypothetical protein V4611_03975 [Patescibacteria group bacterium]
MSHLNPDLKPEAILRFHTAILGEFKYAEARYELEDAGLLEQIRLDFPGGHVWLTNSGERDYVVFDITTDAKGNERILVSERSMVETVDTPRGLNMDDLLSWSLALSLGVLTEVSPIVHTPAIVP